MTRPRVFIASLCRDAFIWRFYNPISSQTYHALAIAIAIATKVRAKGKRKTPYLS